MGVILPLSSESVKWVLGAIFGGFNNSSRKCPGGVFAENCRAQGLDRQSFLYDT